MSEEWHYLAVKRTMEVSHPREREYLDLLLDNLGDNRATAISLKRAISKLLKECRVEPEVALEALLTALPETDETVRAIVTTSRETGQQLLSEAEELRRLHGARA